ncbi:hypothetical protein PsAD2_03618 [Pseudovibrio axinellae]|uniref:Uncharacterized protein n=1 Tax=Pseudovibrio axinellae TaxID=989403 RepID=A0A165VS56_9HYPH|nr:hypothetical protein PsAD2_03618 [Pseudovibrio axinellae]SER53375.1 hypothetical protein SAMN05421798_11215 [Pseudovibrio axinellae]
MAIIQKLTCAVRFYQAKFFSVKDLMGTLFKSQSGDVFILHLANLCDCRRRESIERGVFSRTAVMGGA